MAIKERFNNVFLKLIKHEGGYIYHPNDPGGETKYGISKRSYPGLDIKNLTISKAKSIYLNDWWLKYNYHKLPDGIGEKVFDLSVNMGPRAVSRLLQKALAKQSFHLNVSVRVSDELISKLDQISQKKLLEDLKIVAAERYRYLATRNPRLKVFLRGWLNRAMA